MALDKKSAKNSRQHGIGVAKVQAYAVVKDVLEKGEITIPMDYYKTNPNKEYQTGMIVADVEIGEQVYTCVVTVCLNNEGLIRVWNHEVTPYSNTKPQDASLTNHVFGGETTSHQHQGAMAKVAKEYQKNNNTNEIKNINMKKNAVKLNENTIRKIVAESVKKVLKESINESFETQLTIDLYYENGMYGAYIGSDNASGYECNGKTPEECAEQVASYISDVFSNPYEY